MSCALVSPCGHVELFDFSSVDVNDVLQGPLHAVSLRDFTLYFSSAAFHLTEVNEFASALAHQLIKGDACLVHRQQQPLLECLLKSKHLHLAPYMINSSEAASTDIKITAPPASPATMPAAVSAAGVDTEDASNADSSQAVLLKRPRSLQHIAAANKTRQRILRSMNAAAAALSPQKLSHPQAAQHQHTPVWTAGCMTATDSSNSTSIADLLGPQPGSLMRPSEPGASSTLMLPASRRMPGDPNNRIGNDSSSSKGQSTGSLHGYTSSSSGRANMPVSYSLHSNSSSSIAANNSLGVAASDTSDTEAMDIDEQQQQQSPLGGQAHAAASSTALCGSLPQQHCSTGFQTQHLQQQQQLLRSCPPAAAGVSGGSQGGLQAAASVAAPEIIPAWGDLPVEVIAAVARCLGKTVASVMPVCITCRSWRRAVLDDDQLLCGLTFRLTGGPPTQAAAAAASTMRQLEAPGGKGTRLQCPALLDRAVKLGNVSALVVRARLLDACGQAEDAMRCWRKAAKLGHLEGQLLYGLALYRGAAGVGQDPEDAHLWLTKALKQVQLAKQPSSNAGGSSSSSDRRDTHSSSSSGGGSCMCHALANCTSVSAAAASRETAALHTRVLSQAGLILGYLCFDGEGTRTDKQEAVKFFKLAVQAGCKEAEQVLGWIFNTGQY